jgi:hypothetical protein
MANLNPTITQEFIDNQRKAFGINEKIGSKVFSIKLPLHYEEKMKALPQKERVILMRTAVMSAIDSYDKQ